MDLDDMQVEVEHRFDAPPDDVFAVLTDVERMAGLGPEHQTAQWLDEERTRFSGTNLMGDRTWEVTCHVLVSEPPYRFGWTVGDAEAPSSTWSYDLAADGEGTLVRQRFVLGPGRSFLRHAIGKEPDKAEQYVDGRAAQLRADMLNVLAAAESLLS